MVDESRTRLLILRTWREEGSDDPLRAQIRIANDVSSRSAATVNVADISAALEIVREFLERSSDREFITPRSRHGHDRARTMPMRTRQEGSRDG
jgi:hypothetical protein